MHDFQTPRAVVPRVHHHFSLRLRIADCFRMQDHVTFKPVLSDVKIQQSEITRIWLKGVDKAFPTTRFEFKRGDDREGAVMRTHIEHHKPRPKPSNDKPH